MINTLLVFALSALGVIGLIVVPLLFMSWVERRFVSGLPARSPAAGRQPRRSVGAQRAAAAPGRDVPEPVFEAARHLTAERSLTRTRGRLLSPLRRLPERGSVPAAVVFVALVCAVMSLGRFGLLGPPGAHGHEAPRRRLTAGLQRGSAVT